MTQLLRPAHQAVDRAEKSAESPTPTPMLHTEGTHAPHTPPTAPMPPTATTVLITCPAGQDSVMGATLQAPVAHTSDVAPLPASVAVVAVEETMPGAGSATALRGSLSAPAPLPREAQRAAGGGGTHCALTAQCLTAPKKKSPKTLVLAGNMHACRPAQMAVTLASKLSTTLAGPQPDTVQAPQAPAMAQPASAVVILPMTSPGGHARLPVVL
jgi:hypothetical protein